MSAWPNLWTSEFTAPVDISKPNMMATVERQVTALFTLAAGQYRLDLDAGIRPIL